MLPDFAVVERLLAERDALHDYLARLSDAVTSARERVVTRLRNEYDDRLEVVLEELRGHADTLAAQLAEDRAELAEQIQHFEAAEDAVSETELRHLVGEYDQSRFSHEKNRLDDDKLQCKLALDAAQERVDRLDAVYQLVIAPVTAPGLTTDPTTRQLQVEDQPLPSPELVTPESTPEVNLAWERAYLPETHPDTASELIDAAVASVFDEGEGKEPSAQEVSPTSLDDIPPLGTPPAGQPQFSPVEPVLYQADLYAAPEPISSHVDNPLPAEELVEVEPKSEAARSLKCTECGALNRPLEWYCEKCGAELTAG